MESGLLPMKINKLFRSRLLIVCIVIAVGYFCVRFFIAQAKIDSQSAEYERLKAEYESLIADNSEIQRRIEKGKDASNFEKIARDKYNYVYPDERVYVITP